MRHVIIGMAVLGVGSVVLLSCADTKSATSAPDGGNEGGPDGSGDSDVVDADTTDTSIDNSDAGVGDDDAGDGGSEDGASTGDPPTLEGCPILPSNHIFNTSIAGLPRHPSSDAFMNTIGAGNLHAEFSRTVDPSSSEYVGIPYNVVHGAAMTWSSVRYATTDAEMTWDPRPESDCVTDATHALVSPCTADAAANPLFPIPAAPLVEGGIITDPGHPYGDHHMVVLDQDSCHLWEAYHAYKTGPDGGWDIFASARFDLRSNALRPDTWTSADGAGFPILPLILRASEASGGKINHALRFTVDSSRIRQSYTWPARHRTWNGTESTAQPPMGQAFRIKADYVIPEGFTKQAKAILQALKTYGMYIADGGASWWVTGEPSAEWEKETISQIESISTSIFEAVDLSPIQAREGFDPNSAAVPPP